MWGDGWKQVAGDRLGRHVEAHMGRVLFAMVKSPTPSVDYGASSSL